MHTRDASGLPDDYLCRGRCRMMRSVSYSRNSFRYGWLVCVRQLLDRMVARPLKVVRVPSGLAADDQVLCFLDGQTHDQIGRSPRGE